MAGFWDSRDSYILMLEQVYNEPTDKSVRTLMDKFWGAWRELSANPSEMGARQAVLQTGQALIDGIHAQYGQLKSVRDMIEGDVQGTVKQVNDLVAQIATLDKEITQVRATGDNPNDLLDRRDTLVNQLSSLMDITVNDNDSSQFVVSSGGVHVVQGAHSETLETQPDRTNEGYSNIVWSNTQEQAQFRGGKLASLLQLRDGDARGEIQSLDTMTMNFIDLVNQVHRTGYGLNGETGNDFFQEYPAVLNAQGNYSTQGNGTFDSTYLFRVTGSNTLDAQAQIGLAGTLTFSGKDGPVNIQYFPTDTVGDVVNRINLSGAEVVARLDSQGKLDLKGTPAANKANPDFVIRDIADSGQFLVGYAGILKASGDAGAYTWAKPDEVNALRLQDGASYAVAPLSHPAGWIGVSAKLAQDPSGIASAGSVAGHSAGHRRRLGSAGHRAASHATRHDRLHGDL